MLKFTIFRLLNLLITPSLRLASGKATITALPVYSGPSGFFKFALSLFQIFSQMLLLVLLFLAYLLIAGGSELIITLLSNMN